MAASPAAGSPLGTEKPTGPVCGRIIAKVPQAPASSTPTRKQLSRPIPIREPAKLPSPTADIRAA